jgi:cell division protein FtsB
VVDPQMIQCLSQKARAQASGLDVENKFQPGALSLGLCALILYLAGNAVTGRQGLISYMHLQQQERDLIAEQADLLDQSATLKRRIKALNEASLDVDVLEEVARRQIGAASANETVFELAQNTNAIAP